MTQRTAQQRKALEVWCKQLAKTLDDADLDVQHVMEQKDVAIPWSQELVKELLFRPIFTAMTGEKSTADAETTDYDRVYHVLTRHLGEKLGVTVPIWPNRFGEYDDNATGTEIRENRDAKKEG